MGGKGGGYKRHGKVVWPGFSEVAPRHVASVGRNDPCPCGSGRKYKDCHIDSGEAFLERLALEDDKRRRRETREALKQKGVPWYKRLFR